MLNQLYYLAKSFNLLSTVLTVLSTITWNDFYLADTKTLNFKLYQNTISFSHALITVISMVLFGIFGYYELTRIISLGYFIADIRYCIQNKQVVYIIHHLISIISLQIMWIHPSASKIIWALFWLELANLPMYIVYNDIKIKTQKTYDIMATRAFYMILQVLFGIIFGVFVAGYLHPFSGMMFYAAIIVQFARTLYIYKVICKIKALLNELKYYHCKNR